MAAKTAKEKMQAARDSAATAASEYCAECATEIQDMINNLKAFPDMKVTAVLKSKIQTLAKLAGVSAGSGDADTEGSDGKRTRWDADRKMETVRQFIAGIEGTTFQNSELQRTFRELTGNSKLQASFYKDQIAELTESGVIELAAESTATRKLYNVMK